MTIYSILLIAVLLSVLLLVSFRIVLVIRNYLYNKKILKSYKFDIPVVSIGNITVGGTGKTPHTEMLVEKLQHRYKLAVLSLGYKRKSKGFYIVQADDDYSKCGDEPLQIKRKFPDVIVAVCKKREFAISKLKEEYGVNFVLLDDGFQYRKITPSKNVLLVRYSRPVNKDYLLPFGKLRDLSSGIKRADAVIVTKSPNFAREDGNEYEYLAAERVGREEAKWRKSLSLSDNQRLFFSTQLFGTPLPIFPDKENRRYVYSKFAICFSGIANDEEFLSQLVGSYRIESKLRFSDHREYSKGDIKKIARLASRQQEAVVITTEKDSMRLIHNKWIPDELKSRLFYLPMSCKIIPNASAEEFLQLIDNNN